MIHNTYSNNATYTEVVVLRNWDLKAEEIGADLWLENLCENNRLSLQGTPNYLVDTSLVAKPCFKSVIVYST